MNSCLAYTPGSKTCLVDLKEEYAGDFGAYAGTKASVDFSTAPNVMQDTIKTYITKPLTSTCLSSTNATVGVAAGTKSTSKDTAITTCSTAAIWCPTALLKIIPTTISAEVPSTTLPTHPSPILVESPLSFSFGKTVTSALALSARLATNSAAAQQTTTTSSALLVTKTAVGSDSSALAQTSSVPASAPASVQTSVSVSVSSSLKTSSASMC